MADRADRQDLVDGLVTLLDLEEIEEDIYRGNSPKVTLQRVFGGQVAGQALVAAGRTVSHDRAVHSLHSYFIRPGDPEIPIVYEVDRVRDGRSFTTRRVVAIQHGKAIFSLSASLQLAQDGIDHQSRKPDAPDPRTLPTMTERYDRLTDVPRFHRIEWPLDVRYVDPPTWEDRTPHAEGRRVWMRAAGTLPDDPLLHVCVLTYASDLTLLDAVLSRQGLSVVRDGVKMASLDHAVWFHRPFRADEWFLYNQASPSASGGRGLATGTFFTEDGTHIASVVQEGMIRRRTD
jgi:acyl-CoA thioesterase-2